MNPTQQGADAERAAFEAWYRSEFPGREVRTKNLIGTYTHSHIDWCHTGWQARAAASVPAQEAPAPIAPASAKVGCEGADGFLRIHAESETCDVCTPASPAVSGDAVELLDKYTGKSIARIFSWEDEEFMFVEDVRKLLATNAAAQASADAAPSQQLVTKNPESNQ